MPAGRITVVLGGAGDGKTLFGIQTLVAGARDHGEPGIFIACEESAEQVAENCASFAWKLDELWERKIHVLDARIPQSVVQGGEFDLFGLLAMLDHKVKEVGAKRVVVDGLDMVLRNLEPALVLREVFRLRESLEASGMTSILTAKADGPEGTASPQYDFLHFMADCVVRVQHRVAGGTALRYIRVSKLRGGAHSANEFPFSVGTAGIEIGAGAATEMSHPAFSTRVSSGIERLDAMLGGGYYRGSSTLITGSPGTAKTTLSAAFAAAASRRKERTLYVSFDEAPSQIVRNMTSVALDLKPHVESGILRMHSLRSRAASPEAHVAHIRELLRDHRSRNLVIDPISALGPGGDNDFAQRAAVEILDLVKSRGITSVYTSLLGNRAALSEETPIGISTIADTWMHVTYVDRGGERNRALSIIKSRGTSHSSQVREIVLSKAGVTLADVYSAGGEVLMGTLRWERESAERRKRERAAREFDLRRREAELALAESRARTRSSISAEALQEALLARYDAERGEREDIDERHEFERGERRGTDGVPPAPRSSARSRR